MKSIILVMIICISAPLVSRENSAELRALLQPYSDKLGQLMLENKFDETLECYDENIQLIRPYSPPINGINAMRREVKALKKVGYIYHSISGETKEVWGCKGLIFERATIAFSYSTRQNREIKSYYGSNLAIWRKQADGTYKLKYSIWNLDFNPWEL